jgi:hypothetical protein
LNFETNLLFQLPLFLLIHHATFIMTFKKNKKMVAPARASASSRCSMSSHRSRTPISLPTATLTFLVAVFSCGVALVWKQSSPSPVKVPYEIQSQERRTMIDKDVDSDSPHYSSTHDNDKDWDFGFDADLGIGMDRCNIPRVSEQDLSAEQFAQQYWRKAPVIIERQLPSRAAQRLTEKQTLLAKFGTTDVPLAGYEAYAFRGKADSSTLIDYLQGMKAVTAESAANTTRFAFGIDQFGVGDVYKVPQVVQDLKRGKSNDKNELIVNLEWHFQVAVAESGAGLAFHWHADVFAETLHGVRRWFLYPPETSPVFNPRATSARWLRDQHSQSSPEQQQQALQECTVRPNEAIYVPADWFHSTLSLGQAVSITTSFAAMYRTDRYKLDNGPSDHAYMLDALEQKNFALAIHHCQKLVQHRPHNFSPVAWLGVLHTLHAKTHAGDEQAVVDSLEAARDATRKCIELNPLYAPCQVWQSRQLTALAMIYSQQDDNGSRSMALQQEAQVSRDAAAALSSVDDDEILDPRWQPKSMKQKQ